ncbi:MAG TPA: MHYT domain-containing protein [Gammaproteobacteria bacterium]|jgi:NO-binding membrane sensor protein with MHYT domain|nr:MHYT domain-containing protein [Gammaproteobacteria bacterium]
MLESFFQMTALPANEMLGTYDFRLVILSYIVASFASFVALDITGRLRDVGNTRFVTTVWLIGGAISMGAGIWSMHFIGMLAFNMPMMTMSYDEFWTGFSLLVAIMASAFALFLLKPRIINFIHLFVGGIILGLAIAAMHYTGMQAMKISMNIHYIPWIFFLSIVIAIFASEAALWLALKSNQVVANVKFRLKFVSALIMGAAICGMHYTGMYAAVFTPLETAQQITSAVDPAFLAVGVAVVIFCIFMIAILISTMMEARNQKLLLLAHQAGMAEVAASVLHNVGNVLNSVNVSASTLASKSANSKLNVLSELSKLINDNKHDLVTFFSNDNKGAALPQYIEMLAAQWKNEQSEIALESETLLNNIQHIKHIIDMQQSYSKVTHLEQIVSIASVLDEAILISGIDKTNIVVIKKYASISAVLVDKVKLLQILINLITNAKNALLESTAREKVVSLRISLNDDHQFRIDITDNGVGIRHEDMRRVFTYGFTTRDGGHGFGLHTSALSAKEMGGTITVKSEGVGKGATFTLALPYQVPRK